MPKTAKSRASAPSPISKAAEPVSDAAIEEPPSTAARLCEALHELCDAMRPLASLDPERPLPHRDDVLDCGGGATEPFGGLMVRAWASAEKAWAAVQEGGAGPLALGEPAAEIATALRAVGWPLELCLTGPMKHPVRPPYPCRWFAEPIRDALPALERWCPQLDVIADIGAGTSVTKTRRTPKAVQRLIIKATELLIEDPGRSDRSIAAEVGLHPGQLSKSDVYQSARAGETADRPVRGMKRRDGSVEAFDDDDDAE